MSPNRKKKQLQNQRNVIFCILLVFFSVFLIGIVYAVEIPTQVFINTDPNITSTSLIDSDGGTLQLGSLDNATFNCTGSITDADGYTDITGINATFYGFGYFSNSANTAGAKYSNSSCLLYGGSGNTTSFTCTTFVHHHTLNGTWNCNATVIDSYNRTNSRNGSNTVDVFKSVGVQTQTINFGSYALGNNSGTIDKNITVNNTGNRPINVTLDAYRVSGVASDANAMTCTTGNLPVSALRYSMSPGIIATSKIALTDSPLTAAINLTSTAIGSTLYTNTTLYFGVVIPSSGQGGICTGFLDISAS